MFFPILQIYTNLNPNLPNANLPCQKPKSKTIRIDAKGRKPGASAKKYIKGTNHELIASTFFQNLCPNICVTCPS